MRLSLKNLSLLFILSINAQNISFAVGLSEERNSETVSIRKNATSAVKSLIVPTFASGVSAGLITGIIAFIFQIKPKEYWDILKNSDNEEYGLVMAMTLTGLFSAVISVGSGMYAYKKAKNVTAALKELEAFLRANRKTIA